MKTGIITAKEKENNKTEISLEVFEIIHGGTPKRISSREDAYRAQTPAGAVLGAIEAHLRTHNYDTVIFTAFLDGQTCLITASIKDDFFISDSINVMPWTE